MLRRSLALACLVAAATCALAQGRSRHFIFRYAFAVQNVPEGKRLRVWFPMATSDAWQEVRIISTGGDLPLRRTRDHEYGNAMFYAEADHARQSAYHFEIVYDVVRREHVALLHGRFVGAVELHQVDLSRDLAPDRLVPIAGTAAQAAARDAVAGKTSEIARVRAMYDYVIATMHYDHEGTGWGRGDVLYACDAHHGNCTDFHSLFISMARSQGIPARFEIGFPLPASTSSGQIAGYHCWTEFYLKQRGWVPLDISEAWQHPDKREFFFGGHDANRVQFSVGRDITLDPGQSGEPLNYFVYPYAEVDGAAYPNISHDFAFHDVSGNLAQNR